MAAFPVRRPLLKLRARIPSHTDADADGDGDGEFLIKST